MLLNVKRSLSKGNTRTGALFKTSSHSPASGWDSYTTGSLFGERNYPRRGPLFKTPAALEKGYSPQKYRKALWKEGKKIIRPPPWKLGKN